MLKIVADADIPFLRGILEPFAEVDYIPGDAFDSGHIKSACALIIRTRTKCNEKLLKGSQVKFIASTTIGIDHIDTEYCKNNNIKWINAPGCNSTSVQQYLALALTRLAEKKGTPLYGKTLGIIGSGNVGSKMEKLARLLGMRVLVNDPPRARDEGTKSFVELEDLLTGSDIISLHVPLTFNGEYKTYHLMDSKQFSLMKKGVWLINTARGEVVNSHVLFQEMQKGAIGASILDVWENEPYINPNLVEYTDIATPHIAGYSVEGKANGTASAVRGLSNFFNIPPINWYPGNLPGLSFNEISVEGSGKSDWRLLYEIIQTVYDIMEDDNLLRANLSDFEKIRARYGPRREFSFFRISGKNIPEETCNILRELGFMLDSA